MLDVYKKIEEDRNNIRFDIVRDIDI